MGKYEYFIDWAIHEAACAAGFIEWKTETQAPYPFPHNEVHFVMSGKAEYKYTFQPKHMEQRVQMVEPGDLCLIRYGTIVSIRPIETPYRALYVVMPMPEIPYQPHA